jgi:hypothetical protein
MRKLLALECRCKIWKGGSASFSLNVDEGDVAERAMDLVHVMQDTPLHFLKAVEEATNLFTEFGLLLQGEGDLLLADVSNEPNVLNA